MQFTQEQAVIRERFVTRWNVRCAEVPALELDETWPSVGVLDLLTLTLNGKPEFDPGDKELVRAIALYLAGIIGNAWETFGTLAHCDDGPAGAVLTGETAEGPATLEIEKELTSLLQQRPTSLQIYSGFTRQISTAQGWIGAFAIGCSTGLSPAVRGVWEGESPETFKDNIEKVLVSFGRSAVAYYERVFPDELSGQIGELYLAGGIIPPLGIGEPYPAITGSSALLTQLRQMKIAKKRTLQFAQNLAASPDEHLSSIGLALSGALLEGPPSPALLALSERKGRFSGLLRPALAQLRSIAGLYPDWIREENVESARIDLEKQLGFLPWLQLPGDFIARHWSERKVRRICEALSYFDYDTAADLCDVLIAEEPRQFELRLQRIYLSIINRKFEEAEAALRMLLSEPECETEPRLFSLWGIVSLSIGNTEEALRHLAFAYSAATIGHAQRGSITNDYGWALLQQGRAEEALPLFTEAKRVGGSLLTVTLNEAAALKILGRREEEKRALAECCQLSPLDKRVFTARFLN